MKQTRIYILKKYMRKYQRYLSMLYIKQSTIVRSLRRLRKIRWLILSTKQKESNLLTNSKKIEYWEAALVEFHWIKKLLIDTIDQNLHLFRQHVTQKHFYKQWMKRIWDLHLEIPKVKFHWIKILIRAIYKEILVLIKYKITT